MAKITIPKDVKKFGDATFEKYFKKLKKKSIMPLNKKEAKEGYYSGLLTYIPTVTEWLIFFSYSNDPEIREYKKLCIDKIGDDRFIDVYTKELKMGNKIGNSKLMPMVFKEVLEIIGKANEKAKNEYEAALAAYEKSGNKKDKPAPIKICEDADVIEASKLCVKKTYKKLCKVCDETAAFDIISVFPTDDLVTKHERAHFYRYNQFLDTLYLIAKTKTVNFEDIINILMSEDVQPVFATHCLLERKEKYARLTESQRTLWNNITEWAVKTIDSQDKKTIKDSLEAYIERRKHFAEAGKDGARRIQLSSLSETDYPRLVKAIDNLIVKDDDNKKYL